MQQQAPRALTYRSKAATRRVIKGLLGVASERRSNNSKISRSQKTANLFMYLLFFVTSLIDFYVNLTCLYLFAIV